MEPTHSADSIEGEVGGVIKKSRTTLIRLVDNYT